MYVRREPKSMAVRALCRSSETLSSLTSSVILSSHAGRQDHVEPGWTALAVLLATISQAAFALVYARTAVGRGWAASALAGGAAFALATIGFQRVSLPPVPAFALVTGSLILAILL